ncbi:GNAT family N-acetyltransferase [Kitasatospora sp. NPDC048365]|uniref:GNAT family N-acetyltransferase n=1 Tax=Kitasatospora sp. NPDC048365 TaxID=3364050 RepID=UPI003715B61E
MSDFSELHRMLTDRLDLRAVGQHDLDALHRINADPRTWTHLPEGRHASLATTRDWIDRAAARWHTDGLSYWTARLRSTGEVIGIGGAQRHEPGFWNLYYRFDPVHWGRGYATELARAAHDAAYRHDPDLPFIAWVHAHNAASRAVADRLGLTDLGLRPDPAFGEPMHCYADREVGVLSRRAGV